jgi:hypothetical protein
MATADPPPPASAELMPLKQRLSKAVVDFSGRLYNLRSGALVQVSASVSPSLGRWAHGTGSIGAFSVLLGRKTRAAELNGECVGGV